MGENAGDNLRSKREATGVSGQFFFEHGLTECGISENMEAVGYITWQGACKEWPIPRNDKHREGIPSRVNMCSTSRNLDTPYYLKMKALTYLR